MHSGIEFCELMGFPVSKLQSPTMRTDHDCFNGKSSVFIKYDRLDIDYNLINDRDFPDKDDPDEEAYGIHPLDWDWIDNETGEDVFDRVSDVVFGGSGLVTSVARGLILPGMKATRQIYRKYLRGILQYVALVLGTLLSWELFMNRKVHRTLYEACCGKSEQRKV